MITQRDTASYSAFDLDAMLLADLAKHVEMYISMKDFKSADESVIKLIDHAKELQNKIWREYRISGTV